MKLDDLSGEILKCAFTVHTELGPGLLESAYQACLFYELTQAGFGVEKEKPLPLHYKGVTVNCGYRIDLLVEQKIVLELKAVDAIAPIHMAQMITYLKLTNLKLGLILNFNVLSLKDGIKRVVYNY